MAQYLAQRLHGRKATFSSAGLNVTDGAMHSTAIEVLKRAYSIDASGHKPCQLTTELLAMADVIVAMSPGIAKDIMDRFGVEARYWNIRDPWNEPYEAYRATAERLMEELDKPKFIRSA